MSVYFINIGGGGGFDEVGKSTSFLEAGNYTVDAALFEDGRRLATLQDGWVAVAYLPIDSGGWQQLGQKITYDDDGNVGGRGHRRDRGGRARHPSLRKRGHSEL